MDNKELKESFEKVREAFEDKVLVQDPFGYYLCFIVEELFGPQSDTMLYLNEELQERNMKERHPFIYDSLNKRDSCLYDSFAPFFSDDVELRRQFLNEIIESLS